ncbi:MAG: YncE family protein [Actinomycetota bacterium]|nr:YncE family protein [Actinomycetota bacterium]
MLNNRRATVLLRGVTTHRASPAAVVAAAAAFAVVVTSCGGSAKAPVAVPLPTAPEPAVSPPAAANLPGTIVNQAGSPEGVAITAGGIVGVNVRAPDGLVTFTLAPRSQPQPTTTPLTGSARHLTLGSAQGPFLVPQESDDRFVEVDPVSAKAVATVPVGRQPHDAIAVGSNEFFVADELANTVHIVRDNTVVRVVPAPIQPGGMAENAAGDRVIVVGVRGRRISEYKADGTLIGTANCGAGPTHAVTGSGGLFWVADTNGGAVLGFRLTASGPQQVATLPVGSKPYGLAYDETRATLWVTLTGSDQLVGLHLRGTTVSSKTTYATVRQPNTVAVDEASGRLVVTGSTVPGSLQILG